MKNTIFIVFIIIFALSTHNLSAKDSEGPKLDPRDVLTKHMSDPVVSAIYQFAQLEMAGTVLDFRLHKFLTYEDPIISRATPMIQNYLAEQVRIQLAADRLRHTMVTGMPEDGAGGRLQEMVSLVIKQAKEVMKDFGFSGEQIENAKVEFAFGEVNAYTYGFSKDQVVIVIFDKLLELAKTNPRGLKAVLAHELSHVIARHIQSDLQINMMLSRIVQIALSKNPQKSIDEASPDIMNRFQEMFAASLERGFRDRKFIANNSLETTGMSHQTTSNAVLSIGAALRKNKEFAQLQSQVSTRQVIESSQRFLFEIVRGLETIEVPDRTKEFLRHLAQILPTTLRPNVQDLMEHMSVLVRAISREREMTADLLGISVTDPYASARFHMTLAGGLGLPDKPTRKDIKAAVARVISGLDMSVATTTAEEMAEIIGARGSDHPEANIRIANQILLSRNYQIVAMRKSFLRLVVLRDKLAAQHANIMAKVQQINPENKNMEEFRAQLTESANAIEQSKAELTKNILTLIEQEGLEGKSGANGRLYNLIEYRLNARQFKLALVEYFNLVIKAYNAHHMETSYIERKLEKLKAELAQIDELTKAVMDLKGLSTANLGRLKILTSQPDINAVDALREEMRSEQATKTQDGRADMIGSIMRRKSSKFSASVHHRGSEPSNPTPDGLDCDNLMLRIQ